ncbi:hypothetical protein [Streptomyces sp. NPDC053048]|uniref:hypothetical protein n=1 Tax=Streptomyces sp. NPDC053048 TaxID=3365694 RepID=UPI0037D6EA9B
MAFKDLADILSDENQPFSLVYAPHGNINAGSVHGGQHVQNHSERAPLGRRPVEAHEGPISEGEITAATTGFAEPDWFPLALQKLNTGLLFLTGEPGTGRRTAALNLLHRHSGGSMALHAVDSDVELHSWSPARSEIRGYLVDGLIASYPTQAGMLGNLRRLLREADCRMVIVLPDEPVLVRVLERDLADSHIRYQAPSPRSVFEARLAALVPNQQGRTHLLAGLEPGLIDAMLAPELVPAEVSELITSMMHHMDGARDPAQLHERLSFLAEGEVPSLLSKLHDDPDGLAFLLAACVFEGMDYRIVRDESERLLETAQGRLSSVLGGAHLSKAPALNPQFIFRRPLHDLLHTVRAQCGPKEIHYGPTFGYAVEPVRFTRHRQAETVLRHVWREYGQVSPLLTHWMGAVKDDIELTRRVGSVMGMAASWGGGRRALQHVRDLASSDRASSRMIAAYALGVAGEDLVLVTEVKSRLQGWSKASGWQLRSTVAHACGTEFGIARPDFAMGLLKRLPRDSTNANEESVDEGIQTALLSLFSAGAQSTVFQHLAAWVDSGGHESRHALHACSVLLEDSAWFRQELLEQGEVAERIVTLVGSALDESATFKATSHAVIQWCRTATWDGDRHQALENLLTGLARNPGHGAMRLFVTLDRLDEMELAGRDIAHQALDVWRNNDDPTD